MKIQPLGNWKNDYFQLNRLSFLLILLILLTSVNSYGQAKRSLAGNAAADAPRPAQQTNTDGAPKILLGTIETTTSSRERILAYPRLIPQVLGCDVKGFTFTITAGDKTWTSDPVKGAVFTEDIKDKIKETDAPKMKITIDNIRVNYNGSEVTANPIIIEYDH